MELPDFRKTRVFAVTLGTLGAVGALSWALTINADYALQSLGSGILAFTLLSIFVLLFLRFLPARLAGRRYAPPPAFRLQVLRLLAAAARRGESPGAALAALEGELGGRKRSAVRTVLGRLDSGASLADALSTARARFLTAEEAATLRAVEGTERVAGILAGSGARDREWAAARRRAGIGILYVVPCLLLAWWLASGVLPIYFEIASQVVLTEADGSVMSLDSRSPRFEHLMVVRGLRDFACLIVLLPPLVTGGLGLVLALLSLNALRNDPRIARQLRGVLLRVPGPGRILRLAAGSRVLRVLGALVSSGLPLHEAFSRAAPAAGAPSLEEALEEAAVGIAHGEPLSRVAPACGLPPFAAARLVAASGGPPDSFGRALTALSGECEERALAAASAAAAWTYPLAMTAVAGLVFVLYRSLFLFTGGFQELCRPW